MGAAPKTTFPSDELFRTSDFKSIRMEIHFLNHTTKTEVSPQGMKVAGRITKRNEAISEISIVEILERGFVIDAPKNICAAGHMIELRVLFFNTASPFTFAASAKVNRVSANDGDESTQRIEMEFFQFEENEWKMFLEIFSQKQNELLELLTSMRGY